MDLDCSCSKQAHLGAGESATPTVQKLRRNHEISVPRYRSAAPHKHRAHSGEGRTDEQVDGVGGSRDAGGGYSTKGGGAAVEEPREVHPARQQNRRRRLPIGHASDQWDGF